MPLRRIHLLASIAVTAFVFVLHVLSYFQTSPTHLLQFAVGLSLAAFAPMLIEIFRGRRREANFNRRSQELWTEIMDRSPRWIVVGTNVGYWIFLLSFFVGIFLRHDFRDSAVTAWAMCPSFGALAYSITVFRRPHPVDREPT